MGRTTVTYRKQPDPASQAQRQAASNFQQQRQAQASAYAAAKFNEWATGAQDREALMNARLQNQQSEAELKGAQLRYGMWKDQELQKQVIAYYNAMPALQESLKQAGIYEGSPRYAQEMAAFAAEIPRARTLDPNIRKELHEFSQIDADQAHIHQMMFEQGMSKQEAQIANLKQSLANQGQHPTSFTTTADGGVNVKATRPSDENLKALKLTPTEFVNHVNAKQGKFDESGKFTQSLAPGEQANAIQFQAGTSKNKDTAGQIVTHNIPLAQFNQIRQGQGLNAIPAYSAPTQQGEPSVPTTPAEMVQLTAPDGTSRQVPKDQADHYIKLGATLNQ